MLHSISQPLTSQCFSEIENLELEIESNLLKADLYLQQGHVALRYISLMYVNCFFLYVCVCVFALTILTIWISSFSSEMAVSSLVLMQTSTLIIGSISDHQKPVSELPHPMTGSDQVAYS